MSPENARRVLLAAVGPVATAAPTADALLENLRHIQLDPLDRIGTNADLVAMARGRFRRGEVHQGASFEHFAKERCLLPASAFPHYRDEAQRRGPWRFTQAMRTVPASVCEAVLAEVEERGPLLTRELSEQGRRSAGGKGWVHSSKLSTLALAVLVSQCRLVVCGRAGKQRRHDLPGRVFPEQAEAVVEQPFLSWALGERVRAAGLLSLRAGPWWGAIEEARKAEHPGLVRVEIGGRPYLTSAELLAARVDEDEQLRILGPLDPLLWDRSLVERVFGFTYLWEVYKPAATRRWGYYVCPLLYRGRLVGRIEARQVKAAITVEQIWWEGEAFPDALEAALVRHTELLC